MTAVANEVIAFTWAVLSNWALMLGGIGLTLFGILYERRTQKEIHRRAYRWIVGACLGVAVFLAWRDEYHQRLAFPDELGKRTAERDEAKRDVEAVKKQAEAERQRASALEVQLHQQSLKIGPVQRSYPVPTEKAVLGGMKST